MKEGLTALPALIDPHVHFRTPGATYKEDWISGAKAAIQSGVTTVFDMPNNTPSCTTLQELQNKHALIQNQLEEAGIPLRYHLYFGADRRHYREIPKVKDYAIGIKIFMGCSTGDLLIDDMASLNEIFKMAADHDMLISVHAEDEPTIQQNKKKFVDVQDPLIHSKIRSRQAAALAVEKALNLAEKHRARLCILHVGSKEELSLIRAAKAAGITVYAETSPHHLFLVVDDYLKWGNLVQVNPPLREKEDQDALWEAIRDGTIDYLGTDHAPHTLEEKKLPYGKAPSGLPSIELLLPLLLHAVNQKKIDLNTLVKITRKNIETIFRLPPNDDLVLIDLNRIREVQDEGLKTKCGWSPYRGRVLQGWPVCTIIQGRVFHLDDTHKGIHV